MKIEKTYFTVAEILARWRMTEADLIYLAENDRLTLSVRVFGTPVEFGEYEEVDENQWMRYPTHHRRFDGLLDLRASDAYAVFRAGEARIEVFRAEPNRYVELIEETEPLLVMIGDLLVRREERDRFEAETGFCEADEAALDPAEGIAAAFQPSQDYGFVRLRGRAFRLGAIQAQVVRQLHAAARAGSPWLGGKAVLGAAGSRSLRMADVFKSQPHWRELIRSDGHGLYRLNID